MTGRATHVGDFEAPLLNPWRRVTCCFLPTPTSGGAGSTRARRRLSFPDVFSADLAEAFSEDFPEALRADLAEAFSGALVLLSLVSGQRLLGADG